MYEPIPVFGTIQTPVQSNIWQIEDAEFIVVTDGLTPLIGRDLFDSLGISVTETLNSVEGSTINIITTQCRLNPRIANQFPKLFSRIGRSKIHLVKSKFHRFFQPRHQKGRRVSIHLQCRVNTEK